MAVKRSGAPTQVAVWPESWCRGQGASQEGPRRCKPTATERPDRDGPRRCEADAWLLGLSGPLRGAENTLEFDDGGGGTREPHREPLSWTLQEGDRVGWGRYRIEAVTETKIRAQHPNPKSPQKASQQAGRTVSAPRAAPAARPPEGGAREAPGGPGGRAPTHASPHGSQVGCFSGRRPGDTAPGGGCSWGGGRGAWKPRSRDGGSHAPGPS